jgi:hypothetical protein
MKQTFKACFGQQYYIQIIGLSGLWVTAIGAGAYDWADSRYYRGQTVVDNGTGAVFYLIPRLVYKAFRSDSGYIFLQLLVASFATLFLLNKVDKFITASRALTIFKLLYWVLILSPFFAPWQGSILSEGFFLSFTLIIVASLLGYWNEKSFKHLMLLVASLVCLFFTRPSSVFIILNLAICVALGLLLKKDYRLAGVLSLVATIALVFAVNVSEYDPNPGKITWMDDSYRSLQLGMESPAYLDLMNSESTDQCPRQKVGEILGTGNLDDLKIACPILYEYLNNQNTVLKRFRYIIENPVEYVNTQSVVASTIPNYYTNNAFSIVPDGLISLLVNQQNSDYKINSGSGNRLNAPIFLWIIACLILCILSLKAKHHKDFVMSLFGLATLTSVLFMIQLPGVAETGRHPVPFLFLFYLATMISIGLTLDRHVSTMKIKKK